MNWEYTREEAEKLKAGDYRVEIVSAEEKKSKTGNPMIVVGVRPNKTNITINHYIVKNEYFNRNMTSFFDAFPQIKEGNFNLLEWVGCMGAARLKEDGEYMRVQYFLSPRQAKDIPAWEGKEPEPQKVTNLDELVEDEEMPW